MTFDDWILALHVLSAVAYGAGIILFWVLVVAVRTTDTAEGTLRLGPTVMIGNIAIGIGAGGTIIFGVWLALSVGNYDLWDGWIIAALVLWVIAAVLGQRTGKEYMRGMTKAQELQAAGQSGANAELLALNRTQTGVLLARAGLARLRADRPRHDLEAGRMSILAAIRPDSWNFPLLVHIVGVVLFVGGVVTAAALLGYARGDTRLLRLGYWTLLALALPGYIVLRIGGEWLNEKYNDLTPGVDEPDLARHRLHRRRPRRAAPARLAHHRRHRRVPAARRQGLRAAEDDTRALDRPHRGRPRGRVGDGRQAELALTSRDTARSGLPPGSSSRAGRRPCPRRRSAASSRPRA